jgi:hypothetical protein
MKVSSSDKVGDKTNDRFTQNAGYTSYQIYMVVVVQLVRTSDCGSEGRGFEPHQLPKMPS